MNATAQASPTGQGMNTPTPTAIMNGVSGPIVSENPLSAEHGAFNYWKVCMACHGNRGQGLTDEWRLEGFGEDDMNCWTSKCHAPNHPPGGFDLPRIVPAVVGEGTLRRFVTAADLEQYIFETMPWWDPGALSRQEARELTAFLLRENKRLAHDTELDFRHASNTPVHLPIRDQGRERLGIWSVTFLLGIASASYMLSKRLEVPGAEGVVARARPNFLLHLHPPSIPAMQARWRYTLGAGGIAVGLVLVLGITGTLEMFFYVPTPEQAGPSIQFITYSVPFGGLVRGMHFWAGQALVVVAIIHLARVVFTGAYAAPRRFNFQLGVGLLALVALMNFTGYILRWDEGIRWALVVGSNLLKTIPLVGDDLYRFVMGGDQPGAATLIRFYAWHIFGLTLFFVPLLTWHLFRVRRDGGISAPRPELRQDAGRIPRQELLRREVLAALLAMVGLLVISLLFPAPIAAPIKATATAIEDSYAPWFFLWIQQLLRYGDAFWMGVALPLGLLALYLCLPYILPNIPENQKGRWFPSAGWLAQAITGLAILGWAALTILELM